LPRNKSLTKKIWRFCQEIKISPRRDKTLAKEKGFCQEIEV
jgi:hypothetical protein